jgi:hypothetical protein
MIMFVIIFVSYVFVFPSTAAYSSLFRLGSLLVAVMVGFAAHDAVASAFRRRADRGRV